VRSHSAFTNDHQHDTLPNSARAFMSPILPQYQRLPHDDKNYLESWRNSPVAKEVDDVDLLTTYPPRHGSGTASGSGSRQSVVTFIFVPRWPVKGKKESVLGTMGRDKEETTAMAQRAFPTLAHYPADRIEFLSPEDKDAKIESDGWSRILDDTWDRLYTDGPERLKVQVADGPGEAGKRKWREIAIILGTMSSPIIVGVLVLAILWASGKLDE